MTFSFLLLLLTPVGPAKCVRDRRISCEKIRAIVLQLQQRLTADEPLTFGGWPVSQPTELSGPGRETLGSCGFRPVLVNVGGRFTPRRSGRSALLATFTFAVAEAELSWLVAMVGPVSVHSHLSLSLSLRIQ